MFRWKGKDHVFASVIEPHGSFDDVTENSSGFAGVVERINLIGTNNEATVVEILGKNNLHWYLMINNEEASDTKKHSVEFNGKKFEWIGNFKLVKN